MVVFLRVRACVCGCAKGVTATGSFTILATRRFKGQGLWLLFVMCGRRADNANSIHSAAIVLCGVINEERSLWLIHARRLLWVDFYRIIKCYLSGYLCPLHQDGYVHWINFLNSVFLLEALLVWPLMDLMLLTHHSTARIKQMYLFQLNNGQKGYGILLDPKLHSFVSTRS